MVILTLHEGFLATSESPTRRLAARALVPSFLYALAVLPSLLLRGADPDRCCTGRPLKVIPSHLSMLVPVAWASGRT